MISLTCDECTREFLSFKGMKSHYLAKHPDKYDEFLSKKTEYAEERKTAFVPPTSRVSKRLQLQKKTIEREIISEDSNYSVPDRFKPVFVCPKCEKVFPVYFSASKHIQKHHCVDSEGNSVPFNSPALIKPISREQCTSCGKIGNNDTHNCGDVPSAAAGKEPHEKGLYNCLGCHRSFHSVVLFDDHVASNHNENAEILIFENINEFQTWKAKIESQVRVKYLSLSNTTQRQYYQCNYVSHKNSAEVTHLCPSMMTTREFSKGIHIRYYKDHHGHVIPKQTKTKGDVVNTLMKSNDKDLYVKFKNLLKNIAFSASKINAINLRKVYNSALEMQNSLKIYKEMEKTERLTVKNKMSDRDDNESADDQNYDDDVAQEDNKEDTFTEANMETETTTNKSINDDQITKVLEAPRASARLKRRSVSLATNETKRTKLNTNKASSETELHSKEDNSSTNNSKLNSPKIVNKSPISQSPSFNDTYKQFIGNSCQSDSSIKTAQKYKPIKIETTNEEIAIPTVTVDSTLKVDSTTEVDITPKVVSTVKPIVNKKNISPTNKKVKKERVKTKIGQFISPRKSLNANNSENVEKRKKGPIKTRKTSIVDIKIEDIEYEVVEQENDCNILVLKI